MYNNVHFITFSYSKKKKGRGRLKDRKQAGKQEGKQLDLAWSRDPIADKLPVKRN